jgi:cytochrome c553
MIFAFLALTAFVWASESDELRERAMAMQREAAQLAEQGHNEEATNLKRDAVAMLKKAEHLDHVGLDQRHPEIMRLKALLERIRQKEKHLEGEAGADEVLSLVRREAKEIEMKLHALSQQPRPDQAPPHEDIARRLEHMRIAVDHLNQAGLHDVAEHVAQRAEATERELHEHRPGQGGDVMHEIMQQLDELRHEVARLRQELGELREHR